MTVDLVRLGEALMHQTQPNVRLDIREATATDAAAIAHIYNQGIDDRVATLETEHRSPEERAQWLATRGPRHPVLVAADEAGAVHGWASLNSFNPRPAYDHVADISVYVDRDQRGHGIGHFLLRALEQRARGLGYHKLVLAAFPTNAPGMRLYQCRGFTTVGIYHEQGQLDGHWVDVIIMEKLLT
jgi:phosphinothricin acetyltransferase